MGGISPRPSTGGGGGGGGYGTELDYSPAAGIVDPGAGIAGFSAATGILLITLAGATTFEGLPTGTNRQALICCVLPASVAGSTLTIPSASATAGKPFLNSAGAGGFVFEIGDSFQVVYSPTEAVWLLIV